MVERVADNHKSRQDRQVATGGAISGGVGKNFPDIERNTIGWRATCSCNLDPIPDIVLDPFGGSGTTAEVALKHGRRAILIELNPNYVELQKARLAKVQRVMA